MKRLIAITLLSTILVGLCLLLMYHYHAGFLDSIEARTYDARMRTLTGIATKPSAISVIAIDDKSLGALGRFPWSRMRFAQLLSNVPDSTTVLMDAFFPELESHEADAALEGALRAQGNTYLSEALDIAGDEDVPDITRSLDRFTMAAAGTGQINFLPDEDGVNRWTPLVLVDSDGMPHLSLGLLGAMDHLNMGLDELEPLPDEDTLRLGHLRIPVRYDTTREGHVIIRMLLGYYGPAGAFPRQSFSEIALGQIPPDSLDAKLMFLGATALGVYDMRETPFDPNTPGVEVHASVARNIIEGIFMRRGDTEVAWDTFFIIALPLLVWLASVMFRPSAALPISVLLAAGHAGIVMVMFTRGAWLNIVYPASGITLTYAITVYLRFVLVERKARRMHGIFSSYVSHKIVDQLARDPESARIGGDSKEVTILFSDVKGYTAYSERRTPEEVVETLNEYLGAMSCEILDHDGTLDKFLGDGIMAYWGAPLKQEAHAVHALDCALAMLVRLSELQSKWLSEGKEAFSIRVGIHSGTVVAGNIGAEGRKMEYTVIGDTVNLAARLESSAKLYGVTVLVSGITRGMVDGDYAFRELDLVRVVGKQEPVRVYELVGQKGDMKETKLGEIGRFHKGLALYRERQFDQAADIFRVLSEKGDKASGLYMDRIASYLQSPPPPEWDGVYIRDSK